LDRSRDKRTLFIMSLALVIVTLAVYWQVVNFDYIYYDDDSYVLTNPAVMDGVNLRSVHWALTSNYQSNWHPLTWMSLMLDTSFAKINSWTLDLQLGQQGAGTYHLTNLLLHIANVLLLFLLLYKMTGYKWRAAFVAAIFAIHPLHVESVAWIAERKDVLSTLFWLLTMLLYLDYVRQPSTKRYGLVALAFVLGLMAKPMLVTLPLVLLLMDYWPLARLHGLYNGKPKKGPDSEQECSQATELLSSAQNLTPVTLVKEKLPLFGLSAVSCAVTLWAQNSGGAVASLSTYPIGVRVANAAVVSIAYILKTVRPSDLGVIYRHPGASLPVWQVVCSVLALMGVSFAAIRLARSAPYLAVGWLWYLITLIPVIGLVQVGYQAMADRYTYVPMTGLLLMVGWGIPRLMGAWAGRTLAIVACMVVAGMALGCFRQVGYWSDGVNLYSHTVAVTRDNPNAEFGLGSALYRDGDKDRAIKHLREAVRIAPEYDIARNYLGVALASSGMNKEAVAEFMQVLRHSPNNDGARTNLGMALMQDGKLNEATQEFQKALRINPLNKQAQAGLDAIEGRNWK